MNKEHLPQKIDPFRFAENAITLEGALPVKGMPRLCPLLAQEEGDANIKLAFGVDEQEIPNVRGQVKVSLILRCQRCMESFKYEIIDDFALGIVGSEEKAEELPERYEAVIVKEGELYINEMIEDELIISLPLVPMHDLAECKVTLPFAAGSDLNPEHKENPFNVIEILRSKRKKTD